MVASRPLYISFNDSPFNSYRPDGRGIDMLEPCLTWLGHDGQGCSEKGCSPLISTSSWYFAAESGVPVMR
jgi:hypothetical protein